MGVCVEEITSDFEGFMDDIYRPANSLDRFLLEKVCSTFRHDGADLSQEQCIESIVFFHMEKDDEPLLMAKYYVPEGYKPGMPIKEADLEQRVNFQTTAVELTETKCKWLSARNYLLGDIKVSWAFGQWLT